MGPVPVAAALVPWLAALVPCVAAATSFYNAALLSRTGKVTRGVWGWSDSTRELALVCERTQLSVVDVTDPVAPRLVATVPSLGTDLRSVRTHGRYAYAVNQCGPIQIVDLADPDSIRTVATYRTETVPGAHNVHIDGGYAYLSLWGTDPGDFRILDLADPLAPVEVGSWRHPNMPLPVAGGSGDPGPEDGGLPCPAAPRPGALRPAHDGGGQAATMAHDAFVRGDTAYVAFGGSGWVALDLTDRANPVPLALVSYPDPICHSMWLTEDGGHLLTTDEHEGGHLRVWDVRDLANVRQVASWEPAPGRMIHNVYVRGERAYLAYYADGLRVLDIADPTVPIEVAFHDIHPGPDGAYFEGAYGAYPFAPDGLVYVSDMKRGLHVIQVDAAARGGLFGGEVVEHGTGVALDGARVRFLEIGKAVETIERGEFEIGLPEGAHTMVVEHYGHRPDTLQVIVLSLFNLPQRIALDPLPWGRFRVILQDARTGRPLEGAALAVPGLPGGVRHADATGAVDWGWVPATTYPARAGCFGFEPLALDVEVVPGFGPDLVERTVALVPGFLDDCTWDQGWRLADPTDDATEGRWVRDDPNPSWSGHPGPTSPDWDADITPYGFAFHTGYQLPDKPQELFDVDGGRATLTSPRFDLEPLEDPVLYFHRWFSNDTGANPGEDPFLVELSNDDGVTWTTVAELWESERAWVYREVRVADYLSPTRSMRLRFVASDRGGDSVVEAAVDRIGVRNEVTGAPATTGARLALLPPRPNPTPGGRAAIAFRLPRAAARCRLEAFDVRGRRVALLADGPRAAGLHVVRLGEEQPAPGAGVYWLRLVADGERALRRWVVLPR